MLSISNEKPSISTAIPSIFVKNLELLKSEIFKILGFLHLEFEILGIPSKILVFRKKLEIPGF